MFKRLFWLVIGAGFGFGVSFWVTRFVKETVNRYSPERVSADLGTALKHLGADLRAAATEAVAGMREAEADLRSRIEPNR